MSDYKANTSEFSDKRLETDNNSTLSRDLNLLHDITNHVAMMKCFEQRFSINSVK